MKSFKLTEEEIELITKRLYWDSGFSEYEIEEEVREQKIIDKILTKFRKRWR